MSSVSAITNRTICRVWRIHRDITRAIFPTCKLFCMRVCAAPTSSIANSESMITFATTTPSRHGMHTTRTPPTHHSHTTRTPLAPERCRGGRALAPTTATRTRKALWPSSLCRLRVVVATWPLRHAHVHVSVLTCT